VSREKTFHSIILTQLEKSSFGHLALREVGKRDVAGLDETFATEHLRRLDRIQTGK